MQSGRVKINETNLDSMKPENKSNNKDNCDDMIRLAGEVGVSFFPFYYYWSGDKFNCCRKLYGMFIQELQSFENFLDDHGARLNQKWFYFSELIASMRNLGIVAYLLYHTLHRFDHYKIYEIESESSDFIKETTCSLEFVNKSIKGLFRACIDEAKRLQIPINENLVPYRKYKDIKPLHILEADYESDKARGEKERVLSLARKMRKVAKISKEERYGHKYSSDELLPLVPLKVNEKKARKLKNIIHGVQSDYDTYVKNTILESGNPRLGELRRNLSIPLHLLEAARWLSHFYERHESNSIPNIASEKIAAIVDRKDVLDLIINFLFFFSDHYLQIGNKLAENIMTSYVKKVQYELPVPKPLGFHARPATYVSLIVNEHGTEVEMIVDGKRYNAKSVINLLMASGRIAEKGHQKVIFEGDQEVLDDLKILAENNYCEDKKIPADLNYLKILRNMPGI